MKTTLQKRIRNISERMASFSKNTNLHAMSKAIIVILALFATSLTFGQTTQTFTTDGSFVVPAGVTSISVECWGAGGAGGTRTTNGVAGGGGGGAYSTSVISGLTAGTSFSYTVGTGGITNSGTLTGGDTWFGSSTTVMAKGGTGVGNNTATAGVGGSATAGFGTTKRNGGNGVNGNTAGTDYGGGGGSSAGTLLAGVNAANQNGANAPAGGGDGGDGKSGTQGNGTVGGNPGGGGGGALRTSSGTRTGGGGATGQIKVTYTQLTYKSQFISINTGAATWCPGETRNISVIIKNIGTATWTDNSPDINIGVKWNTNGSNWTDYYIRTDAGNLAPNATQTYILPVTASNNIGAGYTTPLTPGSNNLIFDVVYEGLSWFGNNGGGVGPGNSKFTSPAITIGNIPTSVSALASPNPVCENGTLTITGAATNATGWSWTGPNAFTSSLQSPVILNPGTAAAGIYTLTASNSCGSAAPVNTLNVSVNTKPAVSAGAAVCIGSTMILSPTSGGTWSSSSNAIATVTNAGVVTGVSAGSAIFTFIQTSTGCSNSTPAVTVNTRPTASVTSTPVSICNNGGSTNITGIVTATGSWLLTLSNGATASGTGNGSFSILVNPSTTTTYTISSLSDQNCSSVAGDLTGSTLVTVNQPVAINSQPAPQTVCASFPASFTVDAAGTGLTYQWYLGATPLTDNANITGSATAALNIIQAGVSDAGQYHVVVTGTLPCPPVISADALLTVNQDVVIVDQPQTNILCNGATATFTVNATGTDLTYQWRKGNAPLFDGGRLSGTTTATFTIVNVIPGDAASNYNVVISGSGGVCPQTISANASLIVNPIPDAVATPSNQTACSGANTVNINFTGSVPSTSYNWTRDNPGVTGSIATSGTGNISGNFVNSTNIPVTVTFTIIPMASGCPGAPITATVLVNPTADVVPSPSMQTICTGASITTISSTSAVSGATYSWTRNNPAVTGTIGNSGNGDISGTLINSSSAPVLVSFAITPTANGCAGTPGTATVLVNPSPAAVATPSNQNLCNGNSITTIALSGLTTGTSYNWTRDNPSITGTILNSGSGNISGTLINSGTAPVTVTFIITPSANGCDGLPITATVVVNPATDATATPSSQSKCSGQSITSIVLSGTIPGTVYNWTRNNPAVTGIANSGSGNISGTLTNSGTIPVTVTFTITPSINGCSGTPTSATVTVEPTPSLLVSPLTQNVCYGNNITTINVTNPNGIAQSLSWTRDNPGVTGSIGTSGNGSISGNLINTTNAPITVTFTITAAAANLCSTTITAGVTLYPQLTAPVISASQVVCTGSTPAPLTATAATGGSGVFIYQWQQSTTATGPWTNVGTGGLSYTPPSQDGYYRLIITNICTGSPLTSNVVQISVGGDTGLTFSGSGAPSGAVCPGASFTYSITSANILGQFGGGNYIRYIWSGNPAYISSGTVNPYGQTQTVFFFFTVFTGNATFTVQNSTTAQVITNLTITPTVYNSSGQVVCNLSPTIIPLTINPTPAVNAVSNQTVCNNASTTAINFSGTTGATYSWSNSTPSIGLVASGTGNIPSFTATNSGVNPVTATITVTPLYGTCPGSSKTFTITVNPSPTVNTVANQIVCNNANTTAVNFSGAIAGTVYNWINNDPSIGLASTGTGNIPSFTAVNTGSTPVIATITIIPSYTNGPTCAGVQKQFSITVNPDVNAGTISGTSPLCISGTASYSSSGTTGGSWSSSNTAVAAVNLTTGLVTAIAAGTANIIYTINTGCNSPKTNFKTITVSPNANAGTLSGTSPLCIGATGLYSSNGNPGGTWSSSNTAIATVNPTTGLVNAVSAGTVSIMYTVTGCNAVPSSKLLTVSPNANAGTISGTSPLCPSVTATYSNNGNSGGTWTSSNITIATVNPATGLVTAVSAGTVNIIYTLTTGCNNPVSNFKTLTVGINANAGTVSGPSPLCIGSGAFYFSNGDGGGTWSSSNTAVATVNSSTGFVTPVSSGTTNIIYTVNAGCNAPVTNFKTLTVNPATPSTSGTITGATAVCANTTGFIYSISPVANAATYTWTIPSGWTITSGAGTTSITVTSGSAGGNITVTAGNFCGTSSPGSLAITVTSTGTWLGVTNDWNNPSNWCGGIPTTSTNVIIPVIAGGIYPTTSSATAMAHNSNIASGASVIVNNYTLQISGVVTNAGGIFNAVNGTLELNGTAVSQSIAGSMFYQKTIKDLRISNTSGVSLSGTNDTLKLSGVLKFGVSNALFNTNNNLTLLSSAGGTASVGDMTNNGNNSGNDITGNVTVERYVPNHFKAWQFMAVPTKGQTINAAWQEGNSPLSNTNHPGYGTIITSNVPGAVALGFDVYTAAGPTMKYYDGLTNSWTGVANPAGPIANTKGYMLLVRGDRSVTAFNQAATATILRTTGKLYTVGSEAPPSTTVAGGTFESIGNPYASAINFNNLGRTGGVQDIFYIWDPKLTISDNSAYGLGGYQTFVGPGPTYTVVPGGGSYTNGNTQIESGQAFLVHAPFTGGTVSFAENCKVDGSNVVTRQAGANVKSIRNNLYVSTAGNWVLLDGVLSQFDASYSNTVDAMDALKLNNISENLSLARDGKKLVAERRSEIQNDDTLYYNLGLLRVQQYQFEFITKEFTDANVTAFLEDSYLQTSTPVDLLHDTTRVLFSIVNIPGSYAADRFKLVFKKLTPTPVTITTISAIRNNDKSIAINWKVENETSLQKYTVERSEDGRTFTGIITADPTLNNGGSASYTRNDISPLSRDNFYRINALSLSGQVQYSTIVKVGPLKGIRSITVYPNPVVGKTMQLHLDDQDAGTYGLQLTNKLGQVVYNGTMQVSGSNLVKSVHIPKEISSGSYQLNITAPDGSKTVLPILIQ